ncbi:MAG: 4Fe-4S binding protein [Firmicutes bacterium]|nr:4Fe-4S binding protein [Bacillota bacterium]
MINVQETAKQILALLPGVDCGGYGGCGYPACQACAQAIAEGAPVNQCPACDSEAVAAIAELMGTEPLPAYDKVAFLRCAEGAASKGRLAELKSCREATDYGFLPGECQWGCVGRGDCTARCKFDAMSIDGDLIKIDKEKCTGCQACITSCPQEIITMISREATNLIPCASKDDEENTLAICGHGCIGCGDCEEVCPQEAVQVIDNCAVIDYEKCVGCAACTVNCQKKIIIDEFHDLTVLKREVALVRCVGGAKVSGKLKALGLSDCAEAEKLDLTAAGACSYSCSGLGNCTRVCRYDAISVDSGVALVDEGKCVGCGDCMRACPRDMILMVPYEGVKQMACRSMAPLEERLKACDVGCIGCGDCADNCPNGAISLVAGNPVIDSELCENCGVCTYVCSRNLIVERNVPEYTYIQTDALKLDELHETDERKL